MLLERGKAVAEGGWQYFVQRLPVGVVTDAFVQPRAADPVDGIEQKRFRYADGDAGRIDDFIARRDDGPDAALVPIQVPGHHRNQGKDPERVVAVGDLP